MNYLIWETSVEPGVTGLYYLENVDDAFEINEGISRAKGFPDDALFRMNPNHPKDVKLADQLFNYESHMVVHKKIATFLEAFPLKEVELLPVSILNHKGRVASKDYFIVHPLKVQECVNKDKSNIVWNPLDPDDIAAVFSLVVDFKSVDKSYPIFRPRHLLPRIMVREDLARALQKEAFSGIEFIPPEEFSG